MQMVCGRLSWRPIVLAMTRMLIQGTMALQTASGVAKVHLMQIPVVGMITMMEV